MRFLDPLRSEPVNPLPIEAVLKPTETSPHQRPTETQAQSLRPQKATSSFRFRPDSWLPLADANLLLRKRAQREVQRKQYSTALEVLNYLVVYEADCADHWANRGLVYDHLQQWDKALSDYSHALTLNPALDRVYSNRANLYARQKNWGKALDNYDQAIDLNPLNFRARLNQAITFREMEEYEEALVCLDIALFFQPQSAALYAERGRTYHLYGDWNCAIADYKNALQRIADYQPSQQTADLVDHHQLNARVEAWLSQLC